MLTTSATGGARTPRPPTGAAARRGCSRAGQHVELDHPLPLLGRGVTIGPSSITPALLTRVSSRPSSDDRAPHGARLARSVTSASITDLSRPRTARPVPRAGPCAGRPGPRCTLGRQRRGRGLADAAAGAGHQRHRPFKPLRHGIFTSLRQATFGPSHGLMERTAVPLGCGRRGTVWWEERCGWRGCLGLRCLGRLPCRCRSPALSAPSNSSIPNRPTGTPRSAASVPGRHGQNLAVEVRRAHPGVDDHEDDPEEDAAGVQQEHAADLPADARHGPERVAVGGCADQNAQNIATTPSPIPPGAGCRAATASRRSRPGCSGSTRRTTGRRALVEGHP